MRTREPARRGRARIPGLWGLFGGGLLSAILLVLAGSLWVAAFAVAVSAFAASGLAARAQRQLDLQDEMARRQRPALRLAQVAAAMLGLLGLFIGVLLLMGLAMGWGRML